MPASIAEQVFWLVILAIPVASISRTVTFEEIFREPREWCLHRSQTCRRWYERKFFYLFTCDYCFSHWMALLFVILADFRLLIDDWRGYVIAFFSLAFIANAYLNFYGLLRLDIRRERAEVKTIEKNAEE
jgi:hypothetical protein